MPHFTSLKDYVVSTSENPLTSLFAGLRDARRATNRDDNGKKNAGSHANWLGALGYMAVLDQIGSCFESTRLATGSSIERAMCHFSDLSDDDIQTVYALRCAFAHDYALINVNRPDRTHHFALVADGATPMIARPSTAWDGNVATITPANVTTVNLELLGDLVESVYKRLVQEANTGTLINRFAGGLDELEKRYMIYITG